MKAVRGLSEEQLEATRSPGTLINSNDHPGLAECIGNPRALAALEAMGFRRQQVLEGGHHQQAGAQPATLLGAIDPLRDDRLYVVQSFLVGIPVGGTAWQLGDFGDECFVFPAPVEDDLILDHVYLPKRCSG